MEGFRILPARHGGYCVEGINQQYNMPEVKFAGALAECLEYIRNSFENAGAPASAEGSA